MVPAPPPLAPGQCLEGPFFRERMRILTVQPNGASGCTLGLVGLVSERFRAMPLSTADLVRLTIIAPLRSFDGDARLLRLGLQAYTLGIAWEFHPYFGFSISRDAPEVWRLRPDFETEAVAMRLAMDYERQAGRVPTDVSANNLGYDIKSIDRSSGELRLVEVKGIGGATGTVLLTQNERRVAEDRRDCYWLYVVIDCRSEPRLEPPQRDPASLACREVSKLAHYALSVAALAGGGR